MSINRVNPNGWQYRKSLTSAQINQLDTNTTYGLDKRDGYTDSLESSVTVESDGYITFADDGYLSIIQPENVSIGDGVLSIGAELNGDVNQNDTLRFGFADQTVTSPTTTVANAAYNKFAIRLNGTLTADTDVILPAIAGYTKVIDNQTANNLNQLNSDGYNISDGYLLTVKTPSGNGVVLNGGKSALVYCDGTDIQFGAYTQPNALILIYNNFVPVLPNQLYQAVSFVTATTPGGVVGGSTGGFQKTFTNVKDGDQFQITYTIRMGLTVDGATISFVSANDVAINPITSIQSVVALNAVTVTYSSIYTASSDADITFKLKYEATSTGACTLNIYSPLSLVIKQYRP